MVKGYLERCTPVCQVNRAENNANNCETHNNNGHDYHVRYEQCTMTRRIPKSLNMPPKPTGIYLPWETKM